MKILAAVSALLLLSACATTLPQIVLSGGDTFAVRYDGRTQSVEEADVKANQHCATSAAVFVSAETRYDGLAYRTYRCAGAT
jgi:hypothetical protein